MIFHVADSTPMALWHPCRVGGINSVRAAHCVRHITVEPASRAGLVQPLRELQ